MISWWVSSYRMTFYVGTQRGQIVDSAPIARKFIGQPFANLLRWMQHQGGLRVAQLEIEDE